MSDFAALGLSERLAEAAQAAGYERPTPLQAASIPVLRRGSNVLLHASSGAGVIAAFGLPLLDRLSELDRARGDGPRVLVLTPTVERAEAVAEGLAALAGATGIAVRATGAGWLLAGADMLVATPRQALRVVQDSTLKLEAVQAVVITDASELFALGHGETLETLIPLVPRDAQRVITTVTISDAVEKLVEAHARRALTVPARPADPRAQHTPDPIGQIGYLVVHEEAKPEMLARLLEGVGERSLVYVRTAARAERVAAELGRRGITAARDAGAIQVVAFDHAPEPGVERVVSYDVPFSADDLRAIHAHGGTVLVTPFELAHLQRIAAEVPFTLKHRRARVIERDALDAFRTTIRAALETEDLDAQLLVLEPLLEERSAAEIAAALSALLRRRTPVAPAAADTSVTGPAPRPSTTATFTRLFVSIGSRDNIRPGDLVGAITGEAGIKGDQVGRVDIRDTFSVVEVAADVADRVIRVLNGTTMRGRSLRVDYDRKTGGGGEERRGGRAPGPGRAGPSRGEGPPRGPPRRRPPQDR